MTAVVPKDVVTVAESGARVEVTINRPQSLNALNADVLQSLWMTFRGLTARDDIRAVIITGAGAKAFVAGADIAQMAELGERAIADYVELGQRVMREIECFPMPVIAAVNGYALGGGLELALACDLIVAADSAKVGTPEVTLGVIPGFGGTQRLLHRCGVGTARRLVYTGAMLDAEEALKLGVVDMVVPAAEVLDRARALADEIASRGPLAIREAKAVIRSGMDGELVAGLRAEVSAFLALFRTADREEGMRAFMQKRAAKFTGR